MDRIALERGLTVYFLTLTLRSDDVDKCNRDLNKFLTWLRTRFRRSSKEFYYVWVVELQRKRYTKTGVAALHWHFAIIAPAGALPNVVETWNDGSPKNVIDGDVITFAELGKFWGYGFVWSVVARANLVRYLRKYFLKDYESLEGYNSDWGKLRRFGASQTGHYKFPAWAFDKVNEKISQGFDLHFRKVRGWIVMLGRDVETKKLIEVDRFKGDWQFQFEGNYGTNSSASA